MRLMLKTKYDVLIRNGKERFVVVPERDYKAMQERLEDDADFRAIEASKKRNAGKSLIPHTQVMREFGLAAGRRKRKT
jgi:PHD/YefM family antitoxin component YafN of YafNO toxin-antitoxin module